MQLQVDFINKLIEMDALINLNHDLYHDEIDLCKNEETLALFDIEADNTGYLLLNKNGGHVLTDYEVKKIVSQKTGIDIEALYVHNYFVYIKK